MIHQDFIRIAYVWSREIWWDMGGFFDVWGAKNFCEKGMWKLGEEDDGRCWDESMMTFESQPSFTPLKTLRGLNRSGHDPCSCEQWAVPWQASTWQVLQVLCMFPCECIKVQNSPSMSKTLLFHNFPRPFREDWVRMSHSRIFRRRWIVSNVITLPLPQKYAC